MRFSISLPIALSTLLVTGAAFGQTANNNPNQIKQPDSSPDGTQANATTNGPGSSFQVNYASNFNLGPVNARVINSGASGGTSGNAGYICVNLYQFDAAQNLQSCCDCAISANGLASLPIPGFFSNPLVIKLLATYPNKSQGPSASAPACDARVPVNGADITPAPAPTSTQYLAPGMEAWTDSTPFQSPTHFQVRFEQSVLSKGEAANLSVKCSTGNNTYTGRCSSCPAGI